MNYSDTVNLSVPSKSVSDRLANNLKMPGKFQMVTVTNVSGHFLPFSKSISRTVALIWFGSTLISLQFRRILNKYSVELSCEKR